MRSKVNFPKDGPDTNRHASKTTLGLLALLRGDNWHAQATRFGFVGVINTLIDIFLFLILTQFIIFFAANLVLAKAISYLAATVNSFVLNRKYTFRTATSFVFFVPFIITNLIGLLINTSVLYISVNLVHLSTVIALAFATLAVFIWNFTINKVYIFKVKSTPKDGR